MMKRKKAGLYSIGVLSVLAASILTSSGTVDAEVEAVTKTNIESDSENAFVPFEPYARWSTLDVMVVGEWVADVESRTIHYVYEDGTTAAPNVAERHEFIASYTSTIFETIDEFDAVISPEIEGYTADQAIVPKLLPSMSYEEADALTDSFLASFPLLTDDDVDSPEYERLLDEYLESMTRSHEITVTYKKNADALVPETSETPADSVETPAASESASSLEGLSEIETAPIVTVDGSAAGNAATEEKEGSRGKVAVLPSTGDDAWDVPILAAGIAVLSAGVIGFAARLKRKKS